MGFVDGPTDRSRSAWRSGPTVDHRGNHRGLSLEPAPGRIGRDIIRALEKAGYAIDRQKGSHVILREIVSPFRRITVPDHKEISKGTLRAIIRQTGLTVQQFINLVRD